jgi:hypothetical protein
VADGALAMQGQEAGFNDSAQFKGGDHGGASKKG